MKAELTHFQEGVLYDLWSIERALPKPQQAAAVRVHTWYSATIRSLLRRKLIKILPSRVPALTKLGRDYAITGWGTGIRQGYDPGYDRRLSDPVVHSPSHYGVQPIGPGGGMSD